MHDWLKSWPALALACGLPFNKEGRLCIPSRSKPSKRRHVAGAPLHESLFILTVLQALRSRLIGARDLIIDSAPILVMSDAVILMLPMETRSCSPSSSALTGLSCAYSHLSRFRTPFLLFTLSCQFTRCSFRQDLLWTQVHVRTPEQFECWSWLLVIAFNPLCLARELGQALHRPWERKERPVTPRQVRRIMPSLLLLLGTPARPCLPRGKAPGRIKGFRPQPAQRFPPVRKHPKKPKSSTAPLQSSA